MRAHRAGQLALARGGILHLLRTDAHDHAAGQRALVGQALPAAGQLDSAIPHFTLQELDLAHEVRDERVRRGGVDLARGADLLDHAAVDDHDAVAHRHGLCLVVRDVDDRDAVFLLDLLDLKAHALAQLGVEVGERLIQQQQRRLCHQRAGERHALLLAAGELAGDAVGVLNQVHGGEHALHLLADGRLVLLLDGQRVGDVVKDRHVRPDGIGLEDHADVALFRLEKDLAAGDDAVVEEHAAGGRLFEAGDDAQHRGLAAAGGAQQGDEFPVFKRRVELVQHDRIAKRLGDVLNGYACHTFLHSFNAVRWRIRPW